MKNQKREMEHANQLDHCRKESTAMVLAAMKKRKVKIVARRHTTRKIMNVEDVAGFTGEENCGYNAIVARNGIMQNVLIRGKSVKDNWTI